MMRGGREELYAAESGACPGRAIDVKALARPVNAVAEMLARVSHQEGEALRLLELSAQASTFRCKSSSRHTADSDNEPAAGRAPSETVIHIHVIPRPFGWARW